LSDPGISEQVCALIVQRNDSVVQLELLLLLHAEPARAWTAAEVARQLRIAWATGQLGELAARGLVAPATDVGADGFRYAPSS